MIKGIKVTKMQDVDINEAKEIWIKQYGLYCNNEQFSMYWKEDTSILVKFLSVKIKNQSAIVAKLGDKVVGFLAYDEFPFNGEDSVFCPVIGHAAMEEYKESVYLELYKSISQEWVSRNVFNHMWTILYNDEKLKKVLFDLGYGSYLIDAFNDSNILHSRKVTNDIRKATIKDIYSLYELVKESNQYYASAPLFLRRDEVSLEDIEELISENTVFIAWHQETPIGFINVTIAKNYNFINLSTQNSGLLDEIGAYIRPEYRNNNLGLELLISASEYCKQVGSPHIHVDFETANLYANKFWIKYFTPMLLSMRRTINKDINNR